MSPSPVLTTLAVIGGLMALFWGLGSYPLLQPDEGRNAEIAREMLASGQWLVPTYNGLPYLDKPAFFFKAVALSLGAFGESELAARLPSALFGLATVGLVYAFCRRTYDHRTALLAALMIATSPLFFAFARFVIFDMTLGFFVTAAILTGYCASAASGRTRQHGYAIAAACAGMGTLVKGPVGFIVPTLVLVVFHAWQGVRGWWRHAFAVRNILIFLAVVAPWFIGLSLQHPDFPYYGLVKESFQRFTTDEFRRSAPVYYYFIVILLGLFPWSLLLPESAVRLWQDRRDVRPVDRLLVSWAVAVVVFFSLSQSKLPGYILTATVPLGVLAARLLSAVLEPSPAPPQAAIIRHGALLFALTAAVFAVTSAIPPVVAPEFLERVLPRQAPYLVSLDTGFRWLAGLFALASAACLVSFFRRDVRLATMAFLLFPVALVPILVASMKPYAQHRSAAALMRALPDLPQGTVVVCYRCYPNGWSFYSKRYVTVVTANEGYELQSNYIRYALQRTQAWPDTMIREAAFPGWLEAVDRPALVLAKAGESANLQRLLSEHGASLEPVTDEFVGTLLLPKGTN